MPSPLLFPCVIVTHRFNGAAESVVSPPYNDKEPVVSVAEYRKLLNDTNSSDEQIRARIGYLEGLCRNVARAEIKAYVSKIKNNAKQ
jgi:hypothetical protein